MENRLEKGEYQVASSLDTGGPGWNSLAGQGGTGFEQYSQTFGKYLSDKEGEKNFSEEEKLRRERAKNANRIYKQVCEDFSLGACFFNNFGDWSEYVGGRMSDAEFHNHARTRAQEMAADRN
jgi:hypothetical protein